MHMLLFRIRTSHPYLVLYYTKHETLNLALDFSDKDLLKKGIC